MEQREGRVDRFGQDKPIVKTVLLYGADNEVDLVVLEVLLRKAQTIRRRLGISVPVPVESEQVVSALVNSVLLRGLGQGRQFRLALEDAAVSRVHEAWDQMANKEGRSRAYFAQRGINPDEVARELEEMEPVLGSAEDVQRFLANAIQRFNGELRQTKTQGVFRFLPGTLRDSIIERDGRLKFPMLVSFDGVPPSGATLLGRNHPIVATVADVVLAEALERNNPAYSRSSAIFTNAVSRRTAILILRLRYLIEEQSSQFAEEVVTAAFQSENGVPGWLSPLQDEALRLLKHADIAANMPQVERKLHVEWALSMLQGDWADDIIEERVATLKDAHIRLRRAVKGEKVVVQAHTPPDIIGCYVMVPARTKA